MRWSHAFHHNAFLIVSNGDNARYGSITSGWDHFAEWKRNDEKDKGKVKAEVLLNGMLAKDRLLDIVENFILFDASKPGKTRKVVARNHQVLGVNLAVESVKAQEALKLEYPERRVLNYREALKLKEHREDIPSLSEADREAPALVAETPMSLAKLPFPERAHPDLGRLGVFWHTQGSGKSYSMAFFTEKVRRKISGRVHLRDDDRPRRPGQPDLSDVRRLRGDRPENTPTSEQRQGFEAAARRESPPTSSP